MHFREAEDELLKLSQLAGQLNPKLNETSSTTDQVDLDQLFNFLSKEVPDSIQSGSIRSSSVTNSSETPEKISILDEIDRQMSDLQNEIDRYSMSEAKEDDSEDTPPPPTPPDDEEREPSPPPLPPPIVSGTPPTGTMHLAKPSLPEPEGPPPPPPIQNGYAFNTPHISQEVRNPLQQQLKVSKPKEPIYESIKPRPEPLGGCGDECGQEYGFLTGNNAHNDANTNHVNGVYNNRQQLLTTTNPDREARRVLRVRRELERIQEAAEELDKDEVERFSLIEFAENYFNDHEKSPQGTIVGTLKRSKTSGEMLAKSDMISYYKGNSIPNSHIHMFDPENVNIACIIFKDLIKYAKGENETTEVSTIQSIIRHGLEREELRDEIYVQCVRQLNKNPNPDQVDRIWLLLCLVVVAFPPGKSFFKYFVSFLKDHAQSIPDPTRQYVEWCLENCNHVQAAIRRNPPSTVEVTAMKRLGTIVCRFFFLDGRTKALDVHPCDTAQDVLQKVSDKIGLQSLEGWALYQSLGEHEEHIPQHSYLYDIISDWEIQAKSSQLLNNQKKSTLKKKAIMATNSGSDNRFIMKKRLFWNTREIPSDPIEVSLLYAQAVHSVVKCDELPVSEKVALQLAGLQAQVALGEPQPNRLEVYADIAQFLPQRIRQARFLADREWVPILHDAHKHYGSGKAEVVAKVWYLSCVMQYPLYGCTMFSAAYRGFWSYANNIIIGINAEGVILVKSDDKFILFEFPYAEIESLLLDPSDNFITLNLVKTAQERQRVYVFETDKKAAIGALVAAYRPSLANWIREAEGASAAKRRAKQVTNEDRLRLHQNLVNCRRALVEQNLVKKPLNSEDSGNFFKNTLRRLSNKKQMEKLRAEALANEQGEVYKGFSHAYWAFSKSDMPHTLSNMEDIDEDQALEVFHLILTYAGLMAASSGQPGGAPPMLPKEPAEEDHVCLIQNVLDKAMKKDCLVNELFLQLIKQTTDHPEPNSRVNLRHWSLLALACSVILPVDKLVRKYLLAHLKKCSADFVTEEGKYARFAEKVNSMD